MREVSRQLIHLSGVFFIILSLFTTRLVAAAYFFLIGLTFLLYSLYIIREQNRFRKFLHFLDDKIRGKVMRFERSGIPLQGAIWFYFGCGITFLVFPKDIAVPATLVLAVADSLSTIVGHHFGSKNRSGKSIEGTLTFLVAASAVILIFQPNFLIPAIAATTAELFPALSPSLRQKGILDDNWTIPLVTGAALLFAK